MKPQLGQVAIQQALIQALGLTYRQASNVTGVNARTIWQHVAAHPGSNVASWEQRPEDMQEGAIIEAQKLIDSYAQRHP